MKTPRIGKLTETGGPPGTRGGRDEKLLFNGCRASVWDDAKVLEMTIGDGCTTL